MLLQCDCKQAQNVTLSEKCSKGQWPVPRLPMGSVADAVGTGSDPRVPTGSVEAPIKKKEVGGFRAVSQHIRGQRQNSI
jgi:hypothetical protein